jgi:hypothetical protein
LDSIDSAVEKLAQDLAVKSTFDRLCEGTSTGSESGSGYQGIIINPAAYTQTCIAFGRYCGSRLAHRWGISIKNHRGNHSVIIHTARQWRGADFRIGPPAICLLCAACMSILLSETQKAFAGVTPAKSASRWQRPHHSPIREGSGDFHH